MKLPHTEIPAAIPRFGTFLQIIHMGKILAIIITPLKSLIGIMLPMLAI